MQEGKGKNANLSLTDDGYIPDWPFDKIAIDLITDLNVSMLGNQHIPTIIDQLTGWPEALPIPSKKADTIINIFINNYLPGHMCSRYILSNNGTEFKKSAYEWHTPQLGIDHIFSAPYDPQSNGKLKLCENDLDSRDQYLN